MKKYIALILVLLLAVTLFGCMNSKTEDYAPLSESISSNKTAQNNTQEEYQNKEKKVVDIVDTTPIDRTHPGVMQTFFSDDTFFYSFGYPKSDYIVVKYSDGSKQKLVDALNDGNIKISDLKIYGIKYFTEHKLIKTIIDRVERDNLATGELLEGFFSDEEYSYYFPSIRSRFVTVYYKDGTEELISVALKHGNIKITDLDFFNIGYYKKAKAEEMPVIFHETAQTSPDYTIPTDLDSMLESDMIDLVIEGTYFDRWGTRATKTGQIISKGTATDITVLKGDFTKKEIDISFYGGSMSVMDYIKHVSPDICAKRGYDKMSEAEAARTIISSPKSEWSANPVSGARYLIFLCYNEETNEYFVACDGYGMREVNNKGGVWNPDSKQYEAIE